nr:Biotin synthesis protein BioC [Moritella viscosa]
MAGGKVNSYLTFGKIKKNDPDLFALLTGETGFGEITNKQSPLNTSILNVEKLNKNYKQKINDDGSTSIFYNKKDSDKYPHNHNLKINAEKNKISFGQSSNDHDLKLAYSLAKQNNWSNATSDNKELIQRSMSIAYAENKDDLFFFKTNKPTLKFEELKNIIGDDLLSKDNLIKLYDNNLVVESDKKEVLVFIKNQLKEHKEDITTINSMLADNHSLKECIEKNEKIEKQKEEQKTINEQKLKVVDKRSNLKNDQISEPKPKRAKSSRNRI